jgi:hypothetical protein
MRIRVAPFVVLLLLVAPIPSPAQSGATGTIAGSVTDTTGAVMPGVTVEAASSALIERVRTAVTDDRGEYKVVDLRPGTYTVTFTLSGFSTVKREGLELNTGVTLPVNAELKVGSLEETITVSGASPVVDVQNVRTQNVLTREVLDVVPTAKNFQAFAALTLGAGRTALGDGDVGGNKGDTFTALSIHGGPGGLTLIDGMRTNSGFQSAETHFYQFNPLAVQEVTLETSGVSAESGVGGLNVNMVPKDGGNLFAGAFSGDFSNGSMQGSNLTDTLKARGLTRTNSIRRIYDVGVGFGGPIRRDRLWFFTAHRAQAAVEEKAGIYFNKTQNTLFYTPDPDRPAYRDNYTKDSSIRLNWQATSKQKITAGLGLQDFCFCYYDSGASSNKAPEATYDYHKYPENLAQITWSYPATSRILVQAGWYLRVDGHLSEIVPETGNAIPVTDLGTGITYGSLFTANGATRENYGNHGSQNAWGTRMSMSYITGSHAFKAGVVTMAGQAEVNGEALYNFQYQFRNRVPVGLTQIALPQHSVAKLKMDLGLFGQDQWTIGSLTLNLGVRFDALHSYVPDQTRPAGQFTPAFNISKVDNVPNWKDISPRLGAAYDLFGNGKTAIKWALGRYVNLETTAIAGAVNPAQAIAFSTTRTWNDANGNFVPDCSLTNRAANGECGAMANQSFGTPVAQTKYASDVLLGWGVRPYNWQTSVAMQHELFPGFGLNVGYFRTWYGNFRVTDNLSVSLTDFSSYCIKAPADSRLPGGGGYQVCGIYDVNPNRFGQVDNLVTQASRFGERSQVFNGVDVGINARFGRGGHLSGGISVGQTVIDNCASPEAPAQFCRQTNPFSGQTQVKLQGSYPLPWGLRASATLQNLSGLPVSATYAATNAEIAPSLGRNLAACGAAAVCTATTTLTVLEPTTVFEPRYTIFDVRLSKSIPMGRVKFQPRVDVYNLFNAAAVLSQNNRIGATFRQPLEIIGARFVKLGLQVDF